MAKIRVEIEVPNGNYCDDVDDGYCPMCKRNMWGEYHCFIFGDELDIDGIDAWESRCIRCDECKQAEVLDDTL